MNKIFKLSALKLFFLCFFSLSCVAQAGPHSIEAQLGFNSSKPTFGGDYEYRVYPYLGVGGLFFFAAGDNKKAIPQVMTFAAVAKLHVFENEMVDFYTGPGFGFSVLDVEHKSTGLDEDETILSPLLKTGMLFKINQQFAVGLSHLVLFNWTSNDFGALFNTLQYASVDFRINF